MEYIQRPPNQLHGFPRSLRKHEDYGLTEYYNYTISLPDLILNHLKLCLSIVFNELTRPYTLMVKL